MLKCDQPEKPRKNYVIAKVSKKRAAQIASGEWKPKQPKAIKHRSDRRAKQERQYLTKTRPEFLGANPWCMAKVECKGLPAVEIHHMEGRIEDLLNDKSKMIGLCVDCHRWAEANPEAAKVLNISKNRL